VFQLIRNSLNFPTRYLDER